jgi:hypothetical protein
MKDLKFLLIALLLLSGFNLSAQEAVFVTETETEEETEEDALSISGFVDVYYQYNFNDNPAATTSFADAHNSFELGMANVVFAKNFKKVGFVADLAFGPRANAANGVGGFTTDIIKQLFITYSPTDAITLTAGNFGTHVGYELIDAPGNFNYSTSYMFSNGPFFHTGLKADFALSDNFGAMVGLFNDTDSKSDFGGAPGKNYGAQLSYSDDKAGVYLNYLGGKEDTTAVANQIDLTATYQASEAFLIGVNATTKAYSIEGLSDNPSWFGAALYLNYSISDAVALGLRGEYFDDADGIAYGVADLNFMEYTLSANLTKGNLVFVPELRIDVTSSDFFVDADGAATSISPTIILAAYYAF